MTHPTNTASRARIDLDSIVGVGLIAAGMALVLTLALAG